MMDPAEKLRMTRYRGGDENAVHEELVERFVGRSQIPTESEFRREMVNVLLDWAIHDMVEAGKLKVLSRDERGRPAMVQPINEWGIPTARNAVVRDA